MSESRPGGLTALAWGNFIFGAFGLLNLIAVGVMAGVYLAGPEKMQAEMEAEMDEGIKVFREMGLTTLMVFAVLLLLSAVFELIAGLGYLKQKRFMGRVLGNAFALTSIAAYVTMVVASWNVEGGGVTFGAIIGLLYPGLTLLLINTTFKEDLVN